MTYRLTLDLERAGPDARVTRCIERRTHHEPSYFSSLLKNKYDWVLDPVIAYPSAERLIEVLEDDIVRPAEAKFNELLARRAQELRVKYV